MKLPLLLLLTAPSLLALAATEAAPKPESKVVKPFLWKVEGGGLESPSWLFGTIHLGGKGVSVLHPAVETAFASADVVYTEIPMDMATQLQASLGILRGDGKTLSGSIGERMALEVDTELRAIHPTLNAAPFEAFKTWAVAVSLPLLKSQMAGEKPLDTILWNRAAAAGKKTSALETSKFQTDIFDNLKESDQVILLAETLRHQREQRARKEDGVEMLRTLYLSGDEEKTWDFAHKELADMGEHKELADRMVKLLIDDRNRSLAETIAKHLAATPGKTQFFAVGTAHYLGPNNIRKELEAKGYKITRVLK